jgi:hypothetical protein
VLRSGRPGAARIIPMPARLSSLPKRAGERGLPRGYFALRI